MASSTGSSKFSETTTNTCASGSAPLQLPRHAGRMRGDFLVACLRINAIGFDVFVQADVADRIRIGIGVGKMRPVARIGLDENHLGVYFKGGAHGFGERIARLHGHIDAALVVLWIGIKNHRHLRQAAPGLAGRRLRATRAARRRRCGPLAQDGPPHFDGEFEPARNYREIGEIPAPQAGGIFEGFSPGNQARGTYRSASSPSVSRMAVRIRNRSSLWLDSVSPSSRLFSFITKRAMLMPSRTV